MTKAKVLPFEKKSPTNDISEIKHAGSVKKLSVLLKLYSAQTDKAYDSYLLDRKRLMVTAYEMVRLAETDEDEQDHLDNFLGNEKIRKNCSPYLPLLKKVMMTSKQSITRLAACCDAAAYNNWEAEMFFRKLHGISIKKFITTYSEENKDDQSLQDKSRKKSKTATENPNKNHSTKKSANKISKGKKLKCLYSIIERKGSLELANKYVDGKHICIVDLKKGRSTGKLQFIKKKDIEEVLKQVNLEIN